MSTESHPEHQHRAATGTCEFTEKQQWTGQQRCATRCFSQDTRTQTRGLVALTALLTGAATSTGKQGWPTGAKPLRQRLQDDLRWPCRRHSHLPVCSGKRGWRHKVSQWEQGFTDLKPGLHAPYTGPCVAKVKGRDCGSQAMALENHSLLPHQPISVYGQDRDTPRRACKSWRACVPRVCCFWTPEAQEGKLLPPGIPNPPRKRGSPLLSRPFRAVPACLGKQERLWSSQGIAHCSISTEHFMWPDKSPNIYRPAN